MTDKCERPECGNDANAIFSDSARGIYTKLCAPHIELAKQHYEQQMDQYAIVGLPSEPPEPATGTAALPSTVDHTAPPSALVGEHQALKDKHAEALAALEHQNGLITRLQADLELARQEARTHQRERSIVESQVAARDGEIKRLREAAAAKPATAPASKQTTPAKPAKSGQQT